MQNDQCAVARDAAMHEDTRGVESLPWASWDTELAWAGFSRESIDVPGVWTSDIVVGGMHCAACSITIEQALAHVDGVVRSSVNASTHRAQVVWDGRQTKPSQWLQKIISVGYVAEPVNHWQLTTERRKEQRKLLWRLLVAGFCMMQVMMYAWPTYVAQPGEMTEDMVALMRWASWVLTLPVILFSCTPFFKNAWRDVRHRSLSMDFPVALGIGITFFVSTAVTFDPSGAWGSEVYFDSFTMFVTFLLTGRWLEMKLRHKTAGALDEVMQRLPQWVRRKQARAGEGEGDDEWQMTAISRLSPGDVLQVHMGEAFPCDGVLLSDSAMADEALLTGESWPVQKRQGDALLAGSFNQSGTAQMRVTALGVQTRYAQILSLMQQAATHKPQAAALVDRFAPWFLRGVVLAAVAAGLWVGLDHPAKAWMTVATVLIVTCPCALSLATPAAMLATAGAWARQGVLIRDLQTIETWAAVERMVFDKTGTLTDSHLQVERVRLAAESNESQVRQQASALAVHSLHPASRALASCGQQAAAFDAVKEVPGQGIEALLRTAAGEQVWRLGSLAFCAGRSGREYPDQPDTTASSGPQVALSCNGTWVATFELGESLRADARASLQQLQQQGVQSWLLSGDCDAAVSRVAQALPLQGASAHNTPDGKLAFMKDLQERKATPVAMVGDGLNDAPVLAAAHVSVAFASAAALNREKSDMVVLGDQLSLIARTHAHARKTMHVVRQNLGWALAYNLVCIPLAMTGWLPAWAAGLGMAASSLLVVANSARLARFD
jgi:P-type Cu2+ transporter